MFWLILGLLLVICVWVTNENINKWGGKMVTSIQDFKNQVDSQNLGTKTALDSINTKVIALKAQIAAGSVTPADQLALLDSVLADTTANNSQAQTVDGAATP